MKDMLPGLILLFGGCGLAVLLLVLRDAWRSRRLARRRPGIESSKHSSDATYASQGAGGGSSVDAHHAMHFVVTADGEIEVRAGKSTIALPGVLTDKVIDETFTVAGADRTATPKQRIISLYERARAAAASGENARSEEMLESAIAECKQAQDLSCIAEIVEALAISLERRGERDKALQTLRDYEQHCEQAGHGIDVIYLMHTRGLMARNAGDKLGAMTVVLEATAHCDRMVRALNDAGNFVAQVQVLKLQRNIIWDMPPDAADAVGFARRDEYERVLDAWVSAADTSADPQQVAESRLLSVMSPHSSKSSSEKRKLLDDALATASRHQLAQLEQAITAYQTMLELVGRRG